MRIVGAAQLRDQLRDELRRLRSDPVVIARRGCPVAVMLSVDAWNRLQDRIEELEGEIRVLEGQVGRNGLDRAGPSIVGEAGSVDHLPWEGSTSGNRTVADGWVYDSRVRPPLVDDDPYE